MQIKNRFRSVGCNPSGKNSAVWSQVSLRYPWGLQLAILFALQCFGSGQLYAVEPTIALSIDTPAGAVLAGADARLQLVVTLKGATGHPRDVTRDVTYEVTPATVASVDASGFVTPLADGKARISVVSGEGPTATTEIQVVRFEAAPQVSFPNQIVPIFTKYTCNSGGCHGKSGGQNGFRLSLLGFYPEDDYAYLTKEARGRRLSAAAPEQSLLLRKVTNAAPHGGGLRIEEDSPEYLRLRRWMLQGMPYSGPNDPRLERIFVVPGSQKMALNSSQQLAVFARYSDGAVEDVTRMSQYEANDKGMAEVTATGLVKVSDQSGQVAIMARFQGQVDVFRATIPMGAKIEKLPPKRNFIDDLVLGNLEALGLPPSDVCDDATFLRRVTVDLAGKIPTLGETQMFHADKDPAKRDKLIDRLLVSNEHADFFANKWSAILRNQKLDLNYTRGAYAFYQWIRESVRTNKPYDQFVKELLAATGETSQNPAVVWYRSLPTLDLKVEDSAQLFLGMRLQCAKCHHHPFERWSEDDYYSYAAFFSRLEKKPGAEGRAEEPRFYHQRGAASGKNPRTKKDLKPAGLGDKPLDVPVEQDPRLALANWYSNPENPFFTKALVNRYWKHFFNRGIVEPEDDMRVTNPPTNPELLDALAKSFVKSGFDLRALIRLICQSTVYQLSSVPNEHNGSDKQSFARYYARRLQAEVLYDAISAATDVPIKLPGFPAGTRAVQIPDSSTSNYFLTAFGKPKGNSACECERSGEATLSQSLYLLNSTEVQEKLGAAQGRVARLVADSRRSDAEKIRELYLALYSREPSPEDMEKASGYINAAGEKASAYEDLLWALLNTKEFLFNH